MIVETIMLLLACAPGIYIIYDYTHANSWWFFIGFGLCLVAEVMLIFFFCIFKLQRAYRDSSSIKISSNSNLDPEKQCPFEEYPEIDQLFFNKYTEEARIFQKKNTLKVANLEDYFFEETEINEEPRTQTMQFLKEIKGYYKTLNRFNHTLVDFGKNLFKIEEEGFLIKRKYFFPIFQKSHSSQISLTQLIDEQKQIFHRSQVKLKIKKDSQILILPNWEIVLKCVQFIGTEFAKIEDMRQSNSELLEMISKKVLEDYEFIEKEILQLRKSLEQTRFNLEKLKNQHDRYQAEQLNLNVADEPQMDMMLWLRRQLYEFKDLQRRIRENENNFREQSQKLKYYKEKLASFLDQNKKKYLKILKTRFIAFLDSYFITVDQSIKKIKMVFNCSHSHVERRPPKVNKLSQSKNMNELLSGQITYQKEYFARVSFFQEKLDGLILSMSSISEFLGLMKKILNVIIENLTDCQKNQEKSMKYFSKFFIHLKEKSQQIHNEVSKLREVNQKLREWNEPKLISMKMKIEKYVESSEKILSTININEGPILHKYKLVKGQLETNYKLLEEQIARIQQFEGIYITHNNRIKKIFIISLLNYLSFQKQFVNFGQISEKNFSDNDYDMTQANIMVQNTKNLEKDITNEFDIDKVDGLQTGFSLSPMYIYLLNRFLFVAYTEWKDSQFFKKTLTEELFVAFNSEPNESFSRITVKDMEFSGDPPQIVWLKELKSQQSQSLFDIHITFKGNWSFIIQTDYKLFRMNVPVQLTIEVEELYCVLRLCFVPSKIGKGWFSFIGEPIPKFKITPSIARYTIDLQTLKTIFHNFLLKKMKQNTYPIRQKIPIPVSKKNEDLILIMKKFKALDLQRQG